MILASRGRLFVLLLEVLSFLILILLSLLGIISTVVLLHFLQEGVQMIIGVYVVLSNVNRFSVHAFIAKINSGDFLVTKGTPCRS